MDKVIWGPADPWNNGDFLGAHWLFWAFSVQESPEGLLNWPWGEHGVLSSFPNPFDAWLLGSLFADTDFPLNWNLMMLGHHLLNVVATVYLARVAGGRVLHASAAGALVAASPIMLHEHAMGHTLTAAVWPALFAFGALIKRNTCVAGILIGVQGLCYLYTGLAAGLVALIIRPARGLFLSLLVCGPYLFFLIPGLESANTVRPPDGFNGIPVKGLFGLSSQWHIQLHPLVWLGLGAWFWGDRDTQGLRRRIVMAATLLCLWSLGPHIILNRGDSSVFGSPISFLFDLPGLSRMHHPIRLGMLYTPLLAIALILGLNRRRGIWALGLIAICLTHWRIIDNTAAWSASAQIPGEKAARWLKKNSAAVVDLGSHGMEALSLQTIHGKPILAGFHPRSKPRPGVDATLMQRVDAWAQGQEQPHLPQRLKQLGYSHVIIVDRGPGKTPSEQAIRSQLGPPVYPGVYAL